MFFIFIFMITLCTCGNWTGKQDYSSLHICITYTINILLARYGSAKSYCRDPSLLLMNCHMSKPSWSEFSLTSFTDYLQLCLVWQQVWYWNSCNCKSQCLSWSDTLSASGGRWGWPLPPDCYWTTSPQYKYLLNLCKNKYKYIK